MIGELIFLIINYSEGLVAYLKKNEKRPKGSFTPYNQAVKRITNLQDSQAETPPRIRPTAIIPAGFDETNP